MAPVAVKVGNRKIPALPERGCISDSGQPHPAGALKRPGGPLSLAFWSVSKPGIGFNTGWKPRQSWKSSPTAAHLQPSCRGTRSKWPGNRVVATVPSEACAKGC